MSAPFDDVFYAADDGLRLYARDYRHPAPQATVLCLHGLTRNSADFEPLAPALNDAFRVVAVDQRGRGRSEYDPDPSNYNALVYSRDMLSLLDHLDVERVVLIGTSMGGIISLVMGSQAKHRINGVVLNDVGPEIDARGLERIRSYVGHQAAVTTWAEAAAQVEATNGIAFPGYGPSDWDAFARRLYREGPDGVPVLAHDPAIAESLREASADAPAPDLWPAFDALDGIPILVVRGAESDILEPRVVAEMRRRRPDLVAVDVPDRGHAPMLDEPAAYDAIRAFLGRVAQP